MHIKIISMGCLIVVLAGCSLFGPKITVGEAKLKPSLACPSSFAAYNCAPTPDINNKTSLRLNRFQPAIALKEDGSPRWLDYVGGVIGDDDVQGSDPEYCGRAPFTPFVESDIDPDILPFTLSYTRELENTSTVAATADIMSVLASAGVAESVRDQVKANVEATWKRVANRKVTTKAAYTAVKLKTSILNNVRSNSPDPRFQQCAEQLDNDKSIRLIKALSGYLVESAANDTTVKNTIVAELQASLRNVLSSEEIASITPDLNRVTTETLNTASGKHFVVIAMTFYNPQ